MNHNQKIKILFSKENRRRIWYCYLFTLLEFFAIKNKLLYRLFMKARKPLVLYEINAARITSDDKILVIGCGILPSTLIILSEKIYTKIVGIDNNKSVVKLSKAYINKKRLNNVIKIEFADGINYPVHEYDVIITAINIWPIEQIIEHLANNMKIGSKLVIRSVYNDIFISALMENISAYFIFDSVSDFFPMFPFSKYPRTKTFLLIKK